MKTPQADEALAQQALETMNDPRPEDAEKVRETPPQPGLLAVMDKLPDLNKNQRRIAFLLAKGYTQAEAARSTGVTASYVKHLAHDPRVVELIRVIVGGHLEELAEELSPSQVLERAAARAAEVLAEKIDESMSEDTQVRAALAVLDRTGHGQKREAPITQVIIATDQLAAIEKARQEAGLTKGVDDVTLNESLNGEKHARA